jgi:hypothetical protein
VTRGTRGGTRSKVALLPWRAGTMRVTNCGERLYESTCRTAALGPAMVNPSVEPKSGRTAVGQMFGNGGSLMNGLSDDPLGVAVLDLQAESKALQMIVAFILVQNPAALAVLEQLKPVMGELARQGQLTDRQIAVFRSTLGRMLENVRVCRESFPPAV